ncbi:hypothetical protein HOY34_11670 [Xinfangfangia sp. D13-10-4-6]|uniref:hypothetical protein n=1 Tax=Pseudogemmobacter hezensis TaxID=2737662 RepID=UPI0015551023|nr:hypothetical protein [Pseudogemmobacter hezensis]NPD15856.1 hypothetical protein [Pseudogemmobacter hezensis]
MQLSEADPKGLVRESYRIEGISDGECRSIFIDWALSLGDSRKVPDALRTLIAEYVAGAPDHPMNAVLIAGLMPAPEAKRRGGRLGRAPASA